MDGSEKAHCAIGIVVAGLKEPSDAQQIFLCGVLFEVCNVFHWGILQQTYKAFIGCRLIELKYAIACSSDLPFIVVAHLEYNVKYYPSHML